MPKRIYKAHELAAMASTKEQRIKTQPDLDKKKKIISKLWAKEHIVHRNNTSPPPKLSSKIKALADHLCGMTLKDAALAWRIDSEQLKHFKERFFRADPSLVQFLEELFFDAAVDSLGIFKEKKDELSAAQAAMTAGIFTDKFVNLKKARTADFKPDEVLPLNQLHLLEKILVAGAQVKALHGRTIDVESEVASLQKDEDDATTT
jgi:hypothetical protein